MASKGMLAMLVGALTMHLPFLLLQQQVAQLHSTWGWSIDGVKCNIVNAVCDDQGTIEISPGDGCVPQCADGAAVSDATQIPCPQLSEACKLPLPEGVNETCSDADPFWSSCGYGNIGCRNRLEIGTTVTCPASTDGSRMADPVYLVLAPLLLLSTTYAL